MQKKIQLLLHSRLRHWQKRGRLLAVIGAVVAVAVLVWAGAAHWVGHEYIITDGAQQKTVRLYPGTVDEACQAAGFEGKIVREQYESEGKTYLTLGDTLYATIAYDGRTQSVPFSPCTVEELLLSNGITLDGNELVTPDLNVRLTQDATVTVVSVTYETVTETEEIDYGVLVRESDALEKGVRKLVRSGVKGEKEVTYRVTLQDGRELERVAVSETVVTEPVDCVIDHGIGIAADDTPQQEMAWDEGVIFPGQQASGQAAGASGGTDSTLDAVSGTLSTEGKDEVWSAPTDVSVDTAGKKITLPDGTTQSYSSVLTVKATAYHRLEEGGLITATGTTTQYGTIAVDPSVIPLGSRVFVVAEDGTSWSYGPGLAEDTGGLIKGNRIDLFFMTGTEANNFGVRTAKIYILSDGG